MSDCQHRSQWKYFSPKNVAFFSLKIHYGYILLLLMHCFNMGEEFKLQWVDCIEKCIILPNTMKMSHVLAINMLEQLNPCVAHRTQFSATRMHYGLNLIFVLGRQINDCSRTEYQQVNISTLTCHHLNCACSDCLANAEHECVGWITVGICVLLS